MGSAPPTPEPPGPWAESPWRVGRGPRGQGSTHVARDPRAGSSACCSGAGSASGLRPRRLRPLAGEAHPASARARQGPPALPRPAPLLPEARRWPPGGPSSPGNLPLVILGRSPPLLFCGVTVMIYFCPGPPGVGRLPRLALNK